VTVAHTLETLLVRGLFGGVRAMPWRASLRLGAGTGDLVHALGLRRAVAEANLALA
jgi:lauroyl/myristoyl acyltransferase